MSETDIGPPGARDLLPLLGIVVVVAWGVRSVEPSPWVTTSMALAISLASAGVIGLPALFWALDHGYRRFAVLLLLGLLAGLTPLIVIVLSSVVGLTARGGADRAMTVLEAGAPILGMGLMSWLTFLQAELWAAAIGAVSAAIYWLVFLGSKAPLRRRIR